MTSDNCGECSDKTREELERQQKEQLDKLEDVIRECNHDENLVTRKVVILLRQKKIQPETIVNYMRELLIADLVGAARQRVSAAGPPGMQELERINSLLAAITGSCETGRYLNAERAEAVRTAFYEYVKKNGILLPGGTMPTEGGGEA